MLRGLWLQTLWGPWLNAQTPWELWLQTPWGLWLNAQTLWLQTLSGPWLQTL